MKKHSVFIDIIEAVAVFVLVFLLSFYDAFYSFDSLMKDTLYQQPRGINNKIKIIAIDDETLRELGPLGNWSRQVYADILNALGDNPAVIGMDIMVFGEKDSRGDEALKAACRESGRVVSGSYINYSTAYCVDENGKPYINYLNIKDIEQPIIADYSETGFVNAVADNDGIVRSAFLTADYEGETYDSFAKRIYSMYCRNTGATENTPRLDEKGRMWINYAGRPADYENIPLYAVLNGSVDPRVFKDCIVFVGAYANGLQDQFSVPNSESQMYGVEIHANIVQGLLDGKSLVPAPRFMAALIIAALCAAAYILTKKLPLKVATPIAIVIIAGSVIAFIVINNGGVSFPLIYLPLGALLCYLINLVRKYVEERLEKKKITDAFKKYVAPQVVEEIAKKGGYQIKLGGENRDIAVLFVDIRGFTPMSESLEPEQVVDILNSYLNLTTNSIFANGGTLDKFIGDATMAVFNAPFDLDDYVYRAVKTAWAIVSGGNAIESKFLERYGKSVSFGVGVNCGPAVVGNIGCDFRMDYTAIGDTVNTAARLEANAKRGQVLISESVYERVKDRVTVEPIGEIPLKGKSKGVFVYSLTGISEEAKEIENEQISDNTEA